MPDFERVTDDLRLDLARSPEVRAYVHGFIAGKRKARKEIAVLIAVLVLISMAVGLVVADGWMY